MSTLQVANIVFESTGNNRIQYVAGANTLTLSTAGSERLRVDGGGNVSIGTTNTGAKLYVAGYTAIGNYNGQYQGVTLINGDNSALTQTISYIDSRNNLNTPDASVFMTHETDGSSVIIFNNTSAGSRSSDRRIERMRIDSTGNVLVTGSGGLGYGTGSGGVVTQATSKSTNVTLNKPTGVVTMNNAPLAAAATVAFSVVNSLVTATDTVVLNIVGGVGSSTNYNIWTSTGAGSFGIIVKNVSGGSLSEAIQIGYVIIKGANS